MLIVGNCIVSEEVAECMFCCPLEQCKGECCVEGDAGAPLEQSEIAKIESLMPQVEPYMNDAGRAAIAAAGSVAVVDIEGDLSTPLVNNKECAFVVWEDGKALCAIEKAYRDGKTDFQKPISCHLYPLRITDYGDFIAVNYHRWDICRCAVADGNKTGMRLYQYLKQPLVRRFGEEWYEELVAECEAFLKNK